MNQEGITNWLVTADGLTVTVNTAVDQVGIALAGTPDFELNGATKYINEGENCIIEGFALCFPYQFGQGLLSPLRVQIGWRDSGGNNGSVNELGDTGRVNIPDPNYWYDTFTYVPYPTTATAKWHFEIVGIVGSVSMFNAPAALNTDELQIRAHLKIRTTTDLIA